MAVSILTSEQQDAARDLDEFAVFRELTLQVTNLQHSLGSFDYATPEVHAVSLREMVRGIAVSAEQIELALWSDDTRAWALADTIRMRATKLWDEWRPADGETCLWLALERAVPTTRQLRAIARLCELLHVEMSGQDEAGETPAVLQLA
jgi:hypothetical protein